MARFSFQGYHWKSPTQNAYFAVAILTCITLFACILLGARARWASIEGKGAWRRRFYLLSAIAIFLHLVIVAVNIGLAEGLRTTSVDGHYYVLYILNSMFSQVSDFSILVIMAWTVRMMVFGDFHSRGSPGAIRSVALAGIIIVGTLSIIDWMMYTALLSYFINDTVFDYTLVDSQTGLDVAYMAAFAICSILLCVMAGISVSQDRSRASVLMLLATLFLALRAVLILTDVAILAYSTSTSYGAILNFTWSASFIYLLATMVVYICVGLVGYMSPKLSPREGVVVPPEPHAYESPYKELGREI